MRSFSVLSDKRLPALTQRWLLLLTVALALAYTLTPFMFSWPPTGLTERTQALTALPRLGGVVKLAGHLMGFCLLGALFAVVYGKRVQESHPWKLAIGAAAFCLALELTQFVTESRHARLTDLFCNFGGAALGMIGTLRWPQGRAIRAALTKQILRQSLSVQKGLLALSAVVWFIAGLYPASGVLKPNWDRDFHFVIGNETDQSEPWLGEIRFLGISARAFEDESAALWPKGVEQPARFDVDKESRLLVGYDFTAGKSREIVPRGMLASENLALEVAADQHWAAEGGGILLDKPTLLSSRGPDTELTEAIMAAGKFSVAAEVRPLHRSQSGPARIVSLSEGIWARNFMLGQENADLVFRVRNGVNGTNGMQHALRVRNAVREVMQMIIAEYDHGVSRIVNDGKQVGPVVDLREPGAYLRLGTGAGGRAVGALLLTIVLAVPAAAIAESMGLGRWRHLVAFTLTFCVGSLPYAATCLLVGGPWRWAQFLSLGMVLLLAYPLCLWYCEIQRSECPVIASSS